MLGEIAEAEKARAAFLEARARVPDTRRCTTTPSSTCSAIAEEMLNGELEYRRGNFDVAFAHLRRSVELDDALPYDEPWGWMQPTRHALGALLLEQGQLAEAEAVYRADLGFDGKLSRACWHPDNVWSLHGLHECLTPPRRDAGGAADQGAARPRAGARRGAGAGLLPLPAPGGLSASSARRRWRRAARSYGLGAPL